MKLQPPVAELLGIPIVTLALAVAALSFLIALASLVWQIAKHVTEGGRVRLSMQYSRLSSNGLLTTNHTGSFDLPGSSPEPYVDLVRVAVENPGRYAVSVTGLSLEFVNSSTSPHRFTPFEIDRSTGRVSNRNLEEIRIDPFGQATVYLDLWPAIRALNAPAGIAHIRATARVAGRRNWSKSPKPAWRLATKARTQELDAVTYFYRTFLREGDKLFDPASHSYELALAAGALAIELVNAKDPDLGVVVAALSTVLGKTESQIVATSIWLGPRILSELEGLEWDRVPGHKPT